jgi:hypothetical protein
MPWVGWQPPSSLALRLRAITRAIESLGVMHTQEKNRAHALGSSQALPPLVRRERERHQRYLAHRMKQLRREALRLIARDPELDRRSNSAREPNCLSLYARNKDHMYVPTAVLEAFGFEVKTES